MKGGERMEKDFVCGMEIDKGKAEARFDYQGKTYYFCTSKCKDEFAQSPDSFLK